MKSFANWKENYQKKVNIILILQNNDKFLAFKCCLLLIISYLTKSQIFLQVIFSDDYSVILLSFVLLMDITLRFPHFHCEMLGFRCKSDHMFHLGRNMDASERECHNW